MKLRMLVSLAGSDFALSRGDETERFDDAQAARLIEAAYAVPVESAIAGVSLPEPEAAPSADETSAEPVIDEVARGGVADQELAQDSMDRASDVDKVVPPVELAVAEAAPIPSPIEIDPTITVEDVALPAEAVDAEEYPTEAATEAEPLVVEDDTERAARNPARKRRG